MKFNALTADMIIFHSKHAKTISIAINAFHSFKSESYLNVIIFTHI